MLGERGLDVGEFLDVDTASAEKDPGVIAVLTPFNAMRLPGGAQPADTGDRVVQVFQEDQILYSNQPVAVAIADTFERALHAAGRVKVRVERLPFTVRIDSRVGDAVELLRTHKISELPVIDAEGRPVGLLDITDLIALFPAVTTDETGAAA